MANARSLPPMWGFTPSLDAELTDPLLIRPSESPASSSYSPLEADLREIWLKSTISEREAAENAGAEAGMAGLLKIVELMATGTRLLEQAESEPFEDARASFESAAQTFREAQTAAANAH